MNLQKLNPECIKTYQVYLFLGGNSLIFSTNERSLNEFA